MTLEASQRRGADHNDPPIHNVRHFAQLAAGSQAEPAVHELVRAVSRDRSVTESGRDRRPWSCSARPSEEHDRLAPVRVGKGFRLSFAYTVDDLVTVAQL